jgi:hypothetical protein
MGQGHDKIKTSSNIIVADRAARELTASRICLTRGAIIFLCEDVFEHALTTPGCEEH